MFKLMLERPFTTILLMVAGTTCGTTLIRAARGTDVEFYEIYREHLWGEKPRVKITHRDKKNKKHAKKK